MFFNSIAQVDFVTRHCVIGTAFGLVFIQDCSAEQRPPVQLLDSKACLSPIDNATVIECGPIPAGDSFRIWHRLSFGASVNWANVATVFRYGHCLVMSVSLNSKSTTLTRR
jgi:hypothetical protein